MKHNKYSLVLIIFFLIIFIPLTVLGILNKKDNKEELNPNHDMFYKGKLWFYNDSNELINKYICQTKVCKIAESIIDDEDYNINYYKDGNLTSLPIISYKYVFIEDGDYINLYDIEHDKVLQKYLGIKNYNTNLFNNLFIIKNMDNKWGTLYIDENITSGLSFDYDFMGLKDDFSNDTLNTSLYIVKKDNEWFLISDDGSEKTSKLSDPIIDYTDKYIITNNGAIKIYDYEKKEMLANLKIDAYIYESIYFGIFNNNTLYIYNNLNDNYLKTFIITNPSNVKMSYLDGTLYIYENESLIGTYN